MYGDYYPTGFYGAGPQMQERLAMLEQQRQAQRPALFIRGHLVTGIEEARAAQIMLDGTPSYFPSPAEGKIYEKSIDMNGMPAFKVYALSNEPPKEEKAAGALEALEAKVAELEKAINEMKEEMQMDPFQLIGMLRQAQNPLGMLQQLAGNNPLMGRALAMGNGKSAEELQGIVRNLAQQRGMNEAQLNQFLSGFGLRL